MKFVEKLGSVRVKHGSVSSSESETARVGRQPSRTWKETIQLAWKPLLLYVLQKYVYIAVGSVIAMMIMFGITKVIDIIGIEFPASVVLMLIVFLGLSFSSWIKDEEFTEKYFLRWIDIPFGFNLRWMNVYFTPPFVTLVLADKVSVKEAFIIAAVFIVGYLLGFAFVGYLVWGLQKALGIYNHEDPDKQPVDPEKMDSKSSSPTTATPPLSVSTTTEQDPEELTSAQVSAAVSPAVSDNEYDDYDTESLPAIYNVNTGLSRVQTQIMTHNDEQAGELDDGYALSRIATRNADVTSMVVEETNLDPEFIEKITANFDFFIYSVLFVAGLPIYFCTSYELPLQLAVAVILFKICLLPPPHIKRYLHPILCSFSLSLLVYYILSLIHHQNFKTMISHYKTGRTYLKLFKYSEYSRWPGAGDLLVSMMDVSIAALSLAMYRYRGDLKRFFFALMPVVIVFSFTQFFIYPPLCYHLGISTSRSLGFTGRSVTMALGTPLVDALDGSNQLMAVTTIMSGIIGVFLGDLICFSMLRIRKTDFVSRGVTLGTNCGAVSTAHLLSVDPRAAAMSSLSFTLFGTIMVVMAAIRPLVHIIQNLVGY